MHENTEIRREVSSISYMQQLTNTLRFVVVPAGIQFFHVTDRTTGRVKGFRRSHLEACALARLLDGCAA
ncbi:hypothetical protein ACE1YR_01455 [Pseudomonas sp. K1(2024)]|uniref:Uncharacterized protein n=1 Tax=Pseudomonas boreofloridensis TaxID=3064348 RepID=A0ABV4Z381_9PSED|nr:hypothetical protein [Pseudomonas sp. K13]MDO7900484.1 hypothetical protein [Pseudomonas sp. K13]